METHANMETLLSKIASVSARGSGGQSPPWKPCAPQWDIDRTEPIDGADHDGDRTDLTEHHPGSTRADS
eukprot:6621308-Alexandrium_andersonii.AAC.1